MQMYRSYTIFLYDQIMQQYAPLFMIRYASSLKSKQWANNTEKKLISYILCPILLVIQSVS